MAVELSRPLPTAPLLPPRPTGLGDAAAAADGLRGEGPACRLELGRRGSGEGPADERRADDGRAAAGGAPALRGA